MRKSFALLTFVLSVGTLLADQGSSPAAPGPKASRLDALKSYLQLSDQQVQDMTALLTTFRTSVQPIHQQIMTDQTQLKQELVKSSPDSNVVAQLLVDVKNLRAQIKTKRDALRPQLLAVLSDSQKNSLSTLQQALSVQQAAHQAAALDLIEGPQGGAHGAAGFGRRWRGMNAGMPGQP